MTDTILKYNKTQFTFFMLGAVIAVVFLFISNKHVSAACSVDTSRGVVTQSFTVPADQVGTYRVWTRMAAGTSADKDSFYLEVDGGECITFGGTGLSATGWKWVDYRDGNTNTKVNTASLNAGTHTVKMIGLEDGVMIDKLLFVRSTTCVPVDMVGNPCLPDNTPPTVSVTAPSGALSGTKAMLNAQATDNDAIATVQFFIDGQELYPADNQSPYTYELDTTQYSNGPHQITAQATDVAGNKKMSAAVTVTINNVAPDTTPPSISITSPANNATVPTGVVTVNATATDNVGVTKVSFFVDGSTTPITTSTTPPYTSGNSINLTAGSHTIKATAYDAANLTKDATISLTVTPAPDTTKPSISITSPANNATVPTGVVTVNATATDNVGVTKVSFFVDGSTTPITTSTTPPYTSGNSINLTAGSHTIKAVAYDAANNQQESIITITSTAPAPPLCKFAKFGEPVGRDDLLVLLRNWGNSVPINTNGDCGGPNRVPDGFVDRNDLLQLLRLWGSK